MKHEEKNKMDTSRGNAMDLWDVWCFYGKAMGKTAQLMVGQKSLGSEGG